MDINVRKTLRVAVIATLGVASITGFAYTQAGAKARSIIDPHADLLTMVNVLTPLPGKQSETIRLLQAGMDETMRKQPGFISANIHRSLNSEHVVVYAQWKDQASVDAAGKLIQGGKAPNMTAAFTIAKPAFHPYEVVSVHLSSERK